MKPVIITLFLLIVSACSTTYPAITHYKILGTSKNKPLALQKSCQKYSVKVSQVFVPAFLMTKEMKYIKGSYEEGAFHQSAWAEEPNKAITTALVKALEDAKVFAYVTSYKSFSATDYTLESRVDDFTQHFSADEKSAFVRMDITLRLIENRTGKLVASKHIVKELACQKADAQSGVAALNTLLAETLGLIEQWIVGSCQ